MDSLNFLCCFNLTKYCDLNTIQTAFENLLNKKKKKFRKYNELIFLWDSNPGNSKIWTTRSVLKQVFGQSTAMVRKTMVLPRTMQNPWYGQTMVNQKLQKPVYESYGAGSSPPIGKFIFYFFNIFCPAKPQNHPSTKISAKYWELKKLLQFLG